MSDATAILAGFVASAVPRPADEAPLRRSLVDTREAIRIGRTTPPGRVVMATADDLGDGGPAMTAWRDAGTAAASALGDVITYGSAGAPVWPALLALAEADGGRGDDDIIAAGGIGMRAALALYRSGAYQEAERGYSGTGVFGVLAGAAACSRLLGLDAARAGGALSIAASQAAGALANAGTTLDAMHAAAAARDGLVAAQLARSGVAGAPDILEGRQGFGEAFFGLGASALPDLAAELERGAPLGDVLRLKSHPGHIDHQAPVRVLAAALVGRDRSGVTEIIVEGVPPTSDGNRFSAPRTFEQAAGSLRHALAVVLATGTLTVEDLDPATATAAGHLDRVTVWSSPRWDPRLADPAAAATRITVRWADGAEEFLAVDGA